MSKNKAILLAAVFLIVVIILGHILKKEEPQIVGSLKLTKQWFLNNTNPNTGRLEYEYDPATDNYSSKNNHIRQLGTLWAITELKQFLKDDSLDSLIKNTLDYYLQFKIDKEDYSFLRIEDQSPLAYNAFLILTLVNLPDYPQSPILLSKLAKGVLNQQQDDGSFDTNFASGMISGRDYYPGEAMLALMELYDQDKNPLYLDSVLKAFPYYREYWRNSQTTAFIPWHTQAYFLAFKHTQNSHFSDFIFEMNDWLIDNFQSEGGGFPLDLPKNVTSSYLEGINDAYLLAVLLNDDKHKQKYADSIKRGVEFVLKTQFKRFDPAKNPNRAVGGFKHSLINPKQRIDYTQHATSALIKAYKNGL